MFLRRFKHLLCYKHPEARQLIDRFILELEEEDPAELSDPFSFSPYIQPVIASTTGHIYEKSAIDSWLKGHRTCPFSNTALQSTALVNSNLLDNTIEKFRKDRTNMLARINQIEDANDGAVVEALLEKYKERVKKYIADFNNKKKVLNLQFILEAKEKLKLDINSQDHLKFWSEEKGCCGLGLVRVNKNAKHFYLAPRVYNAFVAANGSYYCLNDFYTAIKKAFAQPVSITSRLFANNSLPMKYFKDMDIEKADYRKIVRLA